MSPDRNTTKGDQVDTNITSRKMNKVTRDQTKSAAGKLTKYLNKTKIKNKKRN